MESLVALIRQLVLQTQNNRMIDQMISCYCQSRPSVDVLVIANEFIFSFQRGICAYIQLTDRQYVTQKRGLQSPNRTPYWKTIPLYLFGVRQNSDCNRFRSLSPRLAIYRKLLRLIERMTLSDSISNFLKLPQFGLK